MQDYEKIRPAREAAGLTQEQLAVAAGLSASSVRAAEAGRASEGTVLVLLRELGLVRVEGGVE